jgi:hypothetical protein
MANSDNSPSVDLMHKSMKGKYDGRRNNGATKARRRLNSDLGRKPHWLKNLDRNDAARVLEQFNGIASPEQIYKAAWEKGKFELYADLYKQFQDRWLGKPYTAENPIKLAAKQPDPRMTEAIAKLLPKRHNEPATPPVM